MDKLPTPLREEKHLLDRQDFDQLFVALRNHGYRIIGPALRDGVIVYDELTSAEDLPAGWTDEQNGGTYRLKRRTDDALFGYNVGPHSWKKFLHPARVRLWQADRQAGKVVKVAEDPPGASKVAFLGVRSCDLHAVAVQDRVFIEGSYANTSYKARREQAFIVAVNCGQAGGTCFCVSMNTGPKVTGAFDLALTEILDAARHYFVLEAGSEQGLTILEEIRHSPAVEKEKQAAENVVAKAAGQMGRQMQTADIKELLYRNYDHPRWENVAARCLACANCTMVCPTCFCTSVEDVTDLKGDHAERWQRWDSCFTIDFSYIHGGSVRSTTKARYRQWMTHKLASWFDQFGTSGCVGCGRCITWCPVGIDLTEEVRAIRETERPAKEMGKDRHGNT
jgi:formate hydrogenlyase subunit 6/NADH:ubiquinone oxidoreductase subunit I